MDASPPLDTSRAKHRLLLELGRGGMGTVYLAVAQGPAGFHKLKVIKRLRADLAHDPALLQMFLDEARLTARLNHPNVAQTNEIGFDGQHYFIEMEFLEGQSLEAVFRAAQKRGERIPLPIALHVIAQALGGLHHAHELVDLDGTPLHVVHRDVSPHNVFVTYEGAVKVLDFGIAKAADSTLETRTGIVKGKPTYMAPEQAFRRPVDRRADVFAVGVILWQALTGKRLWSDLSEVEIFARLELGKIERPRSVRDDVPEELDAICMRALAKDPAERFQTAADFQLAIEDWLARAKERVGARQVAAYLAERFAEERATLRAEIEAQLKEAEPERRAIDVPVVGFSRGGATALTTSRSSPGEVKPRGRARLAIAIAIGSATALAIAAALGVGRSHAPATTAPHAEASARPPIASEDCVVLGDASEAAGDEDTIWIGALFPTSGDDAEAGKAALRGIDLARSDFRMVNGLPPSAPGRANRAIGVVACDAANDPQRAARHLVRDLNVPAVIGFGAETRAIEVMRAELLPARTLSIVALGSSPLLTSVPQDGAGPRLVWRTAASAAQIATVLARVVHDAVEPQLRASQIVSADKPMRVALVRGRDSGGAALVDALFAELTFNDKSIVDNGPSFKQFVLGGPSGEVDAIAASLVKMRPHVILHDGDPAVARAIVAVERDWPAAQARPRWIGATVPNAAIALAARARPDLRERVLGVRTRGTASAHAKFVTRFAESGGAPSADGASAAYDAFFVVAYAAYASHARAITGATLAESIARFGPPGPSVEVGAARIFEAFAALREGGRVDLSGAAGHLRFDASGESPFDGAIVCVGADASAGAIVETGLTYDGVAKKLVGAIRCK